MKDILKNAKIIVEKLAEAGFTAYWAGGCVRDKLLNRDAKDVDIATTAKPNEVLELFPDAKTVGKHFGVVVIPKGGFNFDVATFRKEGPYEDGRHPSSVDFCRPEEDAKRRDFTINGMFYDPIREEYKDFVGGKKDLTNRVVRCIGSPSLRFKEDHLRMLRAVRFAETLEFDIAPETYDAICTHSEKIADISMERIQMELNRILVESKLPGDTIILMKNVGILKPIMPEVIAMEGQEQPPQFHPEGDVFTHTIIMLNNMREKSLELALAALLHDIGKPPTATLDLDNIDKPRIRFNRHAEVGAEMAEDILKRLKYPNSVVNTVAYCIKNHMRFKDVQNMRKSKLRRMIARPSFPIELELHRLDCEASHGMMDNYEFLVRKLKEQEQEPTLPPPLVNGRDIIDMGVAEGPKVGRLLRKVYNYQLEMDCDIGREELLKWTRDQIGENL